MRPGPGIRPDLARARLVILPLASPTAWQRFQGFIRSVGARLMHFGRGR